LGNEILRFAQDDKRVRSISAMFNLLRTYALIYYKS